MISTANKYTTLRTAKAIAIVFASPKTVLACKHGNTPKGNVIDIARAAGILAAKKTPELIPYCHNISLDHVGIDISCLRDRIEILSSVTAIAKTGVEMEALTAASIAALTTYDMLKPIDKDIIISEIKLLEKHGGKSNFAKKAPKGLKAAVVVASDTRHKGNNKDLTGPIIHNWLKNLGFRTKLPMIIPDVRLQIENFLLNLCGEGYDFIITTGGTGLSPRDVTVEATCDIIEKEIPGISETLRGFGQSKTPFSMLSRGIAGLRGKTLIVNLAGSPKAVTDSLNVLTPGILHSFDMIRGKKH